MGIATYSAPSVTLLVLHSNGKKFTYRVSGMPVLIGRGSDNHLVLNDKKVSRHHLRIDFFNDKMTVEDLDSKNGTFMDGERLEAHKATTIEGILTVGFTRIDCIVSAAKDTKKEVQEEAHVIPGDEEEQHEETQIHILDVKDMPQAERVADAPVKYETQPLAEHQTLVIPAHIYRNFLEIASQPTIASALAMLKTHLITVLPVVEGVNFIYTQDTDEERETYNATQDGEFADGYRTAVEKKSAVKMMTVGDLRLIKKIIIPVANHDVVWFLVDIDVNRSLSEQQQNKLHEVVSLLGLCANVLESLFLRAELEQALVGFFETLITTVEAKDTYTYGHSERVCRYATVLAEEMNLSGELRRNLIISAHCHDIGKVGIPDAILKKPTLLSVDEFEEMKRHPTIGAEMLRSLPNVENYIAGVKYHHERWNGTGYPDGLVGEEIPLIARIVALVDAFDAMTSGRTYTSFMSTDEAVERLAVPNQELFDPEIIKMFVKAHANGRLKKEDHTVQPL
ncbi:MAG: HD domain-containing protein [Pseudomonadota bacterium]|nr:HD domain-containing protein [Pseudomonadota bacterium]